jgi:hypothetical protein
MNVELFWAIILLVSLCALLWWMKTLPQSSVLGVFMVGAALFGGYRMLT